MSQMQHDFCDSPVAAKDYSALLGSPFRVFVANGVSEKLDQSGKMKVDFIDLPGLLAAIVQGRVLHPQKLTGDDLRYIRSALCMKSNEIACALDLTPEHYSRCENGHKVLSDEKEKFYRMYAFLAAAFKNKDFSEKLTKEDLMKQAVNCSSPEKAKEAIAAFAKIFLDMKIQNMRPVQSPADLEVKLWLSRRMSVSQCGDDGNWRHEEDIAA